MPIKGSVAPGFERVRDVFEQNFRERNEIGAACCVYLHGERVVDLWAGYRDQKTCAPWNQDTVVCVFSTTKGMAAASMVLAHARGYFDLDETVAKYWPEFAQNGKEAITIRQLLAHQAGLSAIDRRITPQAISDMDAWAHVLAAQKPQWTPGMKHGYHGLSLGFYQNELIRRTDPKHRSIGEFFRDEISIALNADFFIGLPHETPAERIATIEPFALYEMFLHPDRIPIRFLLAMIWPTSLTHRSLMNVDMRGPGDIASTRWIRTQFPSATGLGSARGLARIYGALAWPDPALGLDRRTIADLHAPATPPQSGGHDIVLHSPMSYSWGFVRPCEAFGFGSSARSFGAGGAGGSQAFGDPDIGLGFAYVMNRMSTYMGDDPRAVALKEVTYECAKKLRRDKKAVNAGSG